MARPIDLGAELVAAWRAVRAPDADWLAGIGLDAVATRRIGGRGLTRVRLTRAGLYEPDPDGERAVILPVWEPRGLVDLVAWRPGTNDGVPLARRTGFALCFGALQPFMGDQSLRLWRSPVSWAAARLDGAVILSWREAESYLLAFDTIVAEDVDLAEEAQRHVRRALRRIARAPSIRVAA